jgi:hypothetical protein
VLADSVAMAGAEMGVALPLVEVVPMTWLML